MISGPWFITPHAVQRYVERVRPKARFKDVPFVRGEVRLIRDGDRIKVEPYDVALGELVRWSQMAQVRRQYRPGPDIQLHLPDGREPSEIYIFRTRRWNTVRVRMIVAWSGLEGERPVLITVLKG